MYSVHPSSPLPSVDPVFDVAYEIAHDLDVIDIVLRDLQTAESVFDHDHQFKMIEPIGPEVTNEVRVVGHPFDVHAQMLGDEGPDLFGIKVFKVFSRSQHPSQ